MNTKKFLSGIAASTLLLLLAFSCNTHDSAEEDAVYKQSIDRTEIKKLPSNGIDRTKIKKLPSNG
ncbi:hypothetical protein HCG49_00430 [Arenibacter sp. 6A1]|uniref:hypothetical protein n=1 Tax=Arenibacter sp. 6A1 TaxID=2720391 RepID=UPI001446C8A1|nr:hypothetical protein [Arenibacter sp. 6A1]NKI25021.1 hypothetical protein [Arenibacter sp. 6A1]